MLMEKIEPTQAMLDLFEHGFDPEQYSLDGVDTDTVLTNSILDDSATLNVTSDVTSDQVIAILRLVSISMLDIEHKLNFLYYLQQHDLLEHFTITEFDGNTCIPTDNPYEYIVGGDLINFKEYELLK